MRETLSRLAERNAVAVVSGRDLKDVQKLVGLDSVYYSGSHGFELSGPGNWKHIHEDAADYLPDLDQAEQALRNDRPLPLCAPALILSRKGRAGNRSTI